MVAAGRLQGMLQLSTTEAGYAKEQMFVKFKTLHMQHFWQNFQMRNEIKAQMLLGIYYLLF